MSQNQWILRWETKHPFYRMEAFFKGHARHNIIGSDYQKLLGISKEGTMMMHYAQQDLDRKAGQGLGLLKDSKNIRKHLQETKQLCADIVQQAAALSAGL